MLITLRVINMETSEISVWSTQAPRRGRPHPCGVGGCVVHTTPARGSPRALKRGLATPQCGVTAKTTRKPLRGASMGVARAGQVATRSVAYTRAPATRSVAMRARVSVRECARMGARCRTAFKGVVDPARRGYSSLPPLSPLWGRFRKPIEAPSGAGEAHARMKPARRGGDGDKSIFWLLWLFIDPLREIKKRTPRNQLTC